MVDATGAVVATRTSSSKVSVGESQHRPAPMHFDSRRSSGKEGCWMRSNTRSRRNHRLLTSAVILAAGALAMPATALADHGLTSVSDGAIDTGKETSHHKAQQ